MGIKIGGWDVKVLTKPNPKDLIQWPEYHISNGDVSAGVGSHYTHPAIYQFINDMIQNTGEVDDN